MLHKYTWSIHNANLFLDEDFGNKTTAGQNVYCFFYLFLITGAVWDIKKVQKLIVKKTLKQLNEHYSKHIHYTTPIILHRKNYNVCVHFQT